MSTLTAQIQLRRDTSANWTSNDPILASGEIAFTSDAFYSGTDQQRFKIGDGVQTWSQLDYVPQGGVDEISELQDVNAPSPSNNDGLFYSSGTTKYENKSIATVLGYTPAPLYTFELYADTSNVNPADASVYYSGSLNNFAPETTNTIPFKSIKTNCIYDIYVTALVRSTLGTTENSTVKLKNITQGTEQTLGTIKHSEKINQLYFRTSLSNALNDSLIIKITNPNWVTNPISVMYSYKIKGY